MIWGRSVLFWFTAFAAVLPVLMALVSALYYLGKQRGVYKKLKLKKETRATRELQKLIAELDGRDKKANRLLGEEMASVYEYIKVRVDPAIAGYSSKATACAAFCSCFTILEIVYAAMIPLVLLAPGIDGSRAVITGAVLGALVTVAVAVNAACKFREKWMQYLGLRDRLFAERSLYMASGVYKRDLWRRKDGSSFNFVELCENIIALEYRNLADNMDNADLLNAEPIKSHSDLYDATAEGC
jgi:hypothetical protein